MSGPPGSPRAGPWVHQHMGTHMPLVDNRQDQWHESTWNSNEEPAAQRRTLPTENQSQSTLRAQDQLYTQHISGISHGHYLRTVNTRRRLTTFILPCLSNWLSLSCLVWVSSCFVSCGYFCICSFSSFSLFLGSFFFLFFFPFSFSFLFLPSFHCSGFLTFFLL